MNTISLEFARELIDFAPTKRTRDMGFGTSQLEGAVAAHNMLARNQLAYLADEVGMGKTYVALGVLGLLRHLKPTARVMIIAPRENIQLKWEKELSNFIRSNWRVEDNCVKGLDGRPVHRPIVCGALNELVRVSQSTTNGDLLLRMSSFSAGVKSPADRKRLRSRMLPQVPWVRPRSLRSNDPYDFRDRYARALNTALPDIDLLIVDEAHNLRKGFGPKVSNRNRVLGLALGHPSGFDEEFPRYRRRVHRVLLLSATPFEYDYADIYRQLDVLGFAGFSLTDESGADPLPVGTLIDTEAHEDQKRQLLARMLLRRVAHLKIAGSAYSKNMYRQEWREGGYSSPKVPMTMEDTKQRLVVGLIQKKVAEIIGDRRFNNSFQIGMLSSFESFLESMGRQRRKRLLDAEAGDGDGTRDFEGQQDTATADERKGVDTFSLRKVVTSYKSRFGESLPHPKLDATVDALTNAFETGEKTLVFVRRVATVWELKAKLDAVCDRWLERRMKVALPGLSKKIDQLFDTYRSERRDEIGPRPPVEGDDINDRDSDSTKSDAYDDDTGGRDSFFSWFFRGDGPPGVLSGATFQKHRLSSRSSAYATFFEDDYISWLLGRPQAPMVELARELSIQPQKLRSQLRDRAFSLFRARSKQVSGYPKFYVFEAYQIAALELLNEKGSDLGHRAEIVLQERFGLVREERHEAPPGFPEPEEAIGMSSFLTELVKRPCLRARLWPVAEEGQFRERFRDRERRRILLSGMCRLGASFVDLYLVALRQLGSFSLRRRVEAEQPEQLLAVEFLDLLESQAAKPGFHAFSELEAAATTFEPVVAANFPDIYHQSIGQLADTLGDTLQGQMPIGGMAGGVNKRLVRQFRMPGFPLILVTTDVLQEGEDLHTFCRRVIHYGITWTPSAMEQRTGRIDRIESLVQRELDGRDTPPEAGELIQVYYPHLQDTVELLQVRRVLERLNKFLIMIHSTGKVSEPDESKIDLAQEALRHLTPVPRVEGLLESAFPVNKRWLDGEVGPWAVKRPDIGSLEERLSVFWQWLVSSWDIQEVNTGSRRRYAGTMCLVDGECVRSPIRHNREQIRRQPFSLELCSQVVGQETLVQCVSPVGALPLHDKSVFDDLYHRQWEVGMAKVCVRKNRDGRLWDVWVQSSRLFHVDATQPEEVEDLALNTVKIADALEDSLFEGEDQDPGDWHRSRSRGQGG